MAPPNVQIGRLNADATWWISVDGFRVVFDPWLVGSEVDIAPWFNEAWHVQETVNVGAVEADLVVITQKYADHCHGPTIEALPGSPLFAAIPGAASLIRSVRPSATMYGIPSMDHPPLRVGGLRIWRCSKPWFHPPAYHAVVVADADDRAIIHAPHGLTVSDARALGSRFDVRLLATSRIRFQLPWFLGGAVNPGNEAATAALSACRSPTALAIHDEPKRSRGLVGRLAQVDRGPWPSGETPWLEVPVSAIVGVDLPWNASPSLPPLQEAGSYDDRALVRDVLTEQISDEALSDPYNDVFFLGLRAAWASHPEWLYTELGVADYSFLRRLYLASHCADEQRTLAYARLAESSSITPEDAFGILHRALLTADLIAEDRLAESVCVLEHFRPDLLRVVLRDDRVAPAQRADLLPYLGKSESRKLLRRSQRQIEE